MSALAQQHGAVNLGQGFPDYPIDPVLIDLVTAAMRAGHNQYPLMPGVMALREAIALKVERLYGHAYDPEHEVTVTTGATQAIFTTVIRAATIPLSAFYQEGRDDHVIRFCFAKRDETLLAAGERIARLRC